MSAPPTTIKANGIDVCYEEFGEAGDPPLLLIMGLGAQMTAWDDEFCQSLSGRGLRVIRFDNRDVGKSTWWSTPALDLNAELTKAMSGQPITAPYLLSDMAADAAGLLDTLDISAAHIVGASMGGMIAQTFAIEHPDRTLTLTSIMSTTGDPDVGQPKPEVLGLLLQPAPQTRDAAIEQGVSSARAISWPEHFDEERTRERAAENYDRGFNPIGVGRQLLAILGSGSRSAALADLQVPTLVIHGRGDPLVQLSGGERTAEVIPDAELLVIDDMAHDLPQAHWSPIIERITTLASRAPVA
ncbi:MAG: alpha/beta fold hydrolase [Actinomycetota bacterium]|nr:alpha/beta fold hydrolase [Actinomycetota bacterium]